MSRRAFALPHLLGLLACSFAWAQAFFDLEAGEQRDAVLALAERGVVRAYPDGRFRPDELVSRAALFRVVAALAGLEETPGEACFADVDPQAWYAASLCAAARAGLLRGDGGLARPAQAVRYAEAVATLVRALDGAQNEDGAPWYAPYLARAEALGILAAHRFVPDQPVSRGALAELAYRALEHQQGRLEPVRRSRGCGRPPPSAPPETIWVDGRARALIAVLPESYHLDKPLALLIAFHGRSNDHAQVRRYYGLEVPARDEALVVYPSGLRATDGLFSWSEPGDAASALRDFALFDALLSELSAVYCLDLDRVYLAGHSLGGWFAATLACARAEKVRAVAVVAGSVSAQTCRGPVAALVLHHPDDELVPFTAGLAVRDLFVATNRCALPATEAEPARLGCERYPGCAGGNAVLWCPHDEGRDHRGQVYPHVWPGDAGEAIWDFFRSLD